MDFREQLYVHVGPTGFRLAPSDLTLDDLEVSKIKVIVFDVKYVRTGNSHDVEHNGDYTEWTWASLWMTLNALERLRRSACGDPHASRDNWRICLFVGKFVSSVG